MEAASVPLALGGAQAGIGLYGGLSQNSAVKRSMRSTEDAAQVQIGQIGDQASLEVQKNRNSASQLRSRIRALAAESGFGFTAGSSLSDLDRQAATDEQINQSIIRRNAYTNSQRVASGLRARLAELSLSLSNPLLDAFKGGLSGYQTGLQIQSVMPPTAPPGYNPSAPPDLSIGSGGGLPSYGGSEFA